MYVISHTMSYTILHTMSYTTSHTILQCRIRYRMRYRMLCLIQYSIRYRMRCLMRYCMQDGLMPPLDPEEASGIITRSEQILKEHAKKASLTAKDIIALIQDVLHNPEFNADDVPVDTDMLKRFADSIDSGDLEIIPMQEGGVLKNLNCLSALRRRSCVN